MIQCALFTNSFIKRWISQEGALFQSFATSTLTEKACRAEDRKTAMMEAYSRAVTRGNGIPHAMPFFVAGCGPQYTSVNTEHAQYMTSVMAAVLNKFGGGEGSLAFQVMKDDYPNFKRYTLSKSQDSLVRNRKEHRKWMKRALSSLLETPLSDKQGPTNHIRAMLGATAEHAALDWPHDSTVAMLRREFPDAELFPLEQETNPVFSNDNILATDLATALGKNKFVACILERKIIRGDRCCAGNLPHFSMPALKKGVYHIHKPPFGPGKDLVHYEMCNELGAFLILNFIGLSCDLCDRDGKPIKCAPCFDFRTLWHDHYGSAPSVEDLLNVKLPEITNAKREVIGPECFALGATFRAYFAWLMYTSVLGQYVENTNNFKRAASFFEARKSQYSQYGEDDGITLALDHVEAAQKWTRAFPPTVPPKGRRSAMPSIQAVDKAKGTVLREDVMDAFAAAQKERRRAEAAAAGANSGAVSGARAGANSGAASGAGAGADSGAARGAGASADSGAAGGAGASGK